jgi:hypothetical protein
MGTTSTSPAALRRQARAAERQKQADAREKLRREAAGKTAGRLAAEGAPRPSLRGRPRRSDQSAALYCLTVRLTPDERAAAQAGAAAHKMGLADFVRLQITGAPRTMPTRTVEVPSQVDAAHARSVKALSTDVSWLVSSWPALQSGPLTPDDRAAIGLLLTRLRAACDAVTPAKPHPLSRLLSSARDLVT